MAAHEIQFRGKPCVSVQIESSETLPVQVGGKLVPKNVIRTSDVIFDPQTNWAALQIQMKLPVVDGKAYSAEVDLEYMTISRAVEMEKWFHLVSSSGPGNQTILEMKKEFQFSRVSHSPEDFTLTAFGLTEPEWYVPPRPWWLYSSLVGMGLLLIGAILLRLGKGMWERH